METSTKTREEEIEIMEICGTCYYYEQKGASIGKQPVDCSEDKIKEKVIVYTECVPCKEVSLNMSELCYA